MYLSPSTYHPSSPPVTVLFKDQGGLSAHGKIQNDQWWWQPYSVRQVPPCTVTVSHRTSLVPQGQLCICIAAACQGLCIHNFQPAMGFSLPACWKIINPRDPMSTVCFLRRLLISAVAGQVPWDSGCERQTCMQAVWGSAHGSSAVKRVMGGDDLLWRVALTVELQGSCLKGCSRCRDHSCQSCKARQSWGGFSELSAREARGAFTPLHWWVIGCGWHQEEGATLGKVVFFSPERPVKEDSPWQLGEWVLKGLKGQDRMPSVTETNKSCIKFYHCPA